MILKNLKILCFNNFEYSNIIKKLIEYNEI